MTAATQIRETTTQIKEFSKTEAALATLKKEVSTAVFDLTTKDGMKDARALLRKIVTYRTSLEKKRKELKAPILERGKLLDSEAGRITAELVAIEAPIDKQIQAQVKREEEEAARLAKIEEDRVNEIRARLNDITDIGNKVTVARVRTTEMIDEQLASLAAIVVDSDTFAEFETEALEAKSQTRTMLNGYRVAAEEFEKSEAIRKKQEEELRELREKAAKREKEDAEKAAQEEAKTAEEVIDDIAPDASDPVITDSVTAPTKVSNGITPEEYQYPGAKALRHGISTHFSVPLSVAQQWLDEYIEECPRS